MIKIPTNNLKQILKPTFKFATLLLAAATGLGLATASISATLTAEAFNTQALDITSGTLSLELTDNGAGFATAVSGILPGDTVHRYITLSNTGDTDGKSLTVALSDSESNVLTGNATTGLQGQVTSCSVTWTASTGVCGGTETVLIASTSLNSIKNTPVSLVSSLSANADLNLQFALTLPASTEVTINGVAPANSVQGLTAGLTWTFTESQRTSSTTNS
ncbi:MAG: hypothetical protein RIS75_610 [Actinomycetota bacterium]|jgi:hypothetical protein